MVEIRRFAVIIVAVLFINMFATMDCFTVKASEAPFWSQSILNDAMSIEPDSMALDLAFTWHNTLDISQAMYFMALVAFKNPDVKCTNGPQSGKTVARRLAEYIKKITQPGNEPSCRGGLGGWIDNPVAQALVLAKSTPAVWDNLGSTQQETAEIRQRCDFIMKCMALVGNYTQNFQNQVKTELSQQYSWTKKFNPNLQEGYVGIMIAAYLYFGGAEQVNAFLADFDYDSYLAQMDQYGFSNVKYYFERTGKTLLEAGGTDANGGTAVGSVPFTFEDYLDGSRVEYSPFAIFRSLARKMYYYNTVSEVPINVNDTNGNPIIAKINNGAKSPFAGLLGMAYEFRAWDANGIRSQAEYVFKGLRNSIVTRATLQALGYWEGDGINDLESRMFIGIEDFLYKIKDEHGGYAGYANGTIYPNETESKMIYKNQGYTFLREIWDNMLKKETSYEPILKREGNAVNVQVNGYNFSLSGQQAMAIMAIYDGSRLVKMQIKPLAMSGMSGSSVIAYMNQQVEASNIVKVFVWDSQAGLQPLAEAVQR